MPCGMATKWPQVRYVCDGKAPGQSHRSSPQLILSQGAPTLGLTAPRLSYWSCGPLGKKTRFLAFPAGKWESFFFFFNQHHVPRNLQSSRMQFTLRVARRQNLREGTLLQTESLPLPYELLWEEKDLCSLKSTVEKKTIFSKAS